MSEPIRLWDKYGVAHTFYSPSIVTGLLAQGYTTEPPVAEIIAPLTPNDTQEVATVKPPKRKREKGDGVL